MKFKRLFDITFSVSFLILFSPVMVLVAILIKLDSKGHILFKQERLGKEGKVFWMYKFRTMIENAEHMGAGLFNYKNDFRVTRIGKFLRLASLDELPQLYNVLKGDMSFIGPRPPVVYELGRYEDLPNRYKRRFVIRPGMTGLAQVTGRNELSWEEKIIYDLEYIKEAGFWLDLKIAFLTLLKVVSMKETYEIRKEGAGK